MKRALSIVFFLGLIFVSISLTHRVPILFTQQTTSSGSATLPTGWGVSEVETDFKNITNLNASNWIIGNQTINNYTNDLFKFVSNNNVTKCPIDTPFLRDSDTKCINCTGDKPVFDLYKKDCVACPAGTQLNTATHQCEAGAKPTSKCGGNFIWDEKQQRCVCPPDFPVDLGCECVTCLEPFTWNANQRACKLRCEESHVWNNKTQACECPKSAQYEVNGECISCNAPFQWKAGSNSCELKVNACPTSVTPVTPVTPTTPTTQSCTSNFVWDSNVQKCVCPSNLPFNDGTKCVACNLPQYWNDDTKQCVYCPTNTYFNTVARSCQACPSDRPLYRNYACEACPADASYDAGTNSCQSMGIDPSFTSKVPVFTTTPTASGDSIDPAFTPKVPVYSTTTTPVGM